MAVTANVLALVAQIPELYTLPRENGMMHYPVFGRIVALAVALLAPVALVPWSLWQAREDAAQGLLTLRRWLSHGLAICMAFSVIPATMLGLRVASWFMRVHLFWR